MIIPLIVVGYLAVSGSDSIKMSLSAESLVVILLYYAVLFVVGVAWLIKQLRLTLSIKSEMRKNEIQHLQSQVNPHFFFNMLNNIYGTIDKDAELAKQIVLKLSDLMRYSIYEGCKENVLLKDEVAFLKKYIYLHSIRYQKAIDVNVDVEIENDKLEIMPLLLIILVENAFKHGVEKLRENAYIHLYLKAIDKEIHFELENNFDETEVFEGNGIGISNLRRRLDLVYPDNYKLSIDKSISTYRATLNINL
ncbi:histidine kinase [Aurantibacter sp.]|uniref:sensor histidine kinase n=1 Tax=Aurantibacter sp. TaxID=2807103 RepID=UPI003267B2DD